MALDNLEAHPDSVDVALTKRRHVRVNSRDNLGVRSAHRTIDVDVSAGDTIQLTTEQQLPNRLIRLTGSPAGAFTVELADGDGRFSFINVSGETATIETATGAASPPTLLDGIVKAIHEHGTDLTVVGIIGLQSGALIRDGLVSPTAAIDWADFLLQKPEFKDTSVTVATPSSSSGTLTLDMEVANVFDVALFEDVTTIVLDNPPLSPAVGYITVIFTQDSTGFWTLTWPGTVIWALADFAVLLEGTEGHILLEDGSGILLMETQSTEEQTLDPNSVDIYTLVTLNAGSTWYAIPIGLNMQ